MTLLEDIGILAALKTHGTIPAYPHAIEALNLGIEALKRLQANRGPTTTEAWIPLPGETKD